MGVDAWHERMAEWLGMNPAHRPNRLVCVLEDGGGDDGIHEDARRLGVMACDVGDERWMMAPSSPAVITGTHDEIFSRALNRGYGVRADMWNMQFGLLNNDCLWVDGTDSGLHAALSDLRSRLPTFRTPETVDPSQCHTQDIPIHGLFGTGNMSDIARFMPKDMIDQDGSIILGDISDIARFMRRPVDGWEGIRPPAGRHLGTQWITLAEHLSMTERLISDVCPAGVPDIGSLRTAARYHDYGKAHPEFQRWLLQGLPQNEHESRAATAWAKRRPKAALGRIDYSHEIAGAGALLRLHPGDHLAAYLVMSHHGRFRSDIPDTTGSLPRTDLGDGMVADEVSFMVTSEGWRKTFGGLYRRYGPFLLSYYEALLRTADMIASDSDERRQ